MRLYTFELNQRPRVGAEWQGQLVDVAAAFSAAQGEPRPFPTDVHQLVRSEHGRAAAQQALEFVKKRRAAPVGEQLLYPMDAVRLLAPMPRPRKILCCEANYRSHTDENPVPSIATGPFFFARMPSTVIGPGEAIVRPRMTDQLACGVELAVVIGRRIKNAAETEVMSSVFGYTILNGVSAGDIQFRDNQQTLARNFDTFCPLGPCVVTTDELPDPSNLWLRTYLNGELKQSSTTAEWIFRVPRLLSYLSQFMTLEPGDIVSTGTPSAPPYWLQAGDVVSLEIEGVGSLENRIVAEA